MANIVDFFSRRSSPAARPRSGLESLVSGYSIEVMPRTAAKIDDFRALLPAGTRVYIAHIEGTPFEDMLATAVRLREEGFAAMPHIPARAIESRAQLEEWLTRYRDEADVRQALLLAGGIAKPYGPFDSSMAMAETGLFDKLGYTRLHVAGHPEGNRDIDVDGGERSVMAAAKWKQDFAERTGAEMAMVTQFVFEADPVFDWIERLRAEGVDLPVHLGVAGPAKLQTMIKFAAACGVGPSFRVLQRRAKDVRKLMMPHEPTEMLTEVAARLETSPPNTIAQLHFFPLGGIRACTEWANAQLAEADRSFG